MVSGRRYLYTKRKCSQKVSLVVRASYPSPEKQSVYSIAPADWARAGLDSTSNKVFSKVGPKGKRDMASEEVRMFEEEQEQSMRLLRPNNVLGQNGMISNQLNNRGHP